MRVEMFTFLVTGAICLAGALGVVLFRNPVHNALSLIATLFGVAVLFVAQEAYFLAAIQVIVYAGAIVILFLFVIMLLGVDKAESLQREPIVGQRPVAVVAGVALVGLLLTALLSSAAEVTGAQSVMAPLSDGMPDIDRLGRVLFTDYIYAVEITAVLLTIAVVGAVVLARRSPEPIDLDEFPDGTVAERMRERAAVAAAAEDAADGTDADESDPDGSESADAASAEAEEVER
ncbi:MAG: NADH-quinone oxidoreductase subunit J [Microthrixaceae bacterium]